MRFIEFILSVFALSVLLHHQTKTNNIMQKFNFKNQLKGKDLKWLLEFKEETTNTMLILASSGHKDAQKYNRYISYIDDSINKLKL